jgi:hypothetical protein
VTSPITPGTPVTVVLTGATYEFSHVRTYNSPTTDGDEDGTTHVVRAADGRLLALDDDVWSVVPTDASAPTVLTPALRSVAHRAAREAGDLAPLNTAVEAALTALEPVVAGLVAQGRWEMAAGVTDLLNDVDAAPDPDTRRRRMQAVRDWLRQEVGEDV